MNKLTSFIPYATALFTLMACGGGGGGDDTTTPAASSIEGVYVGTSTSQPGAISSVITGIFLDSKDFYVFYDNVLGKGAIMGEVNANGSSRFNSDAIDLGTDAGLLSLAVSGEVSSNELNGTIDYTGSDVGASYTATYDTAYESTPSLTELAGLYSVEFISQTNIDDDAEVEIATDGTITGSSLSCDFTGTTATRTKGNVFNVEITLTGDSCSLNTQTLSGIIYYDQTNDLIYSGMLLPDRSDAFVFLGEKTIIN